MFATNESTADRVIRAIAGVVLLVLGAAGVISGVVGTIAIVIGAILLLTGAIGFCPLYALLKIRTNKSKA